MEAVTLVRHRTKVRIPYDLAELPESLKLCCRVDCSRGSFPWRARHSTPSSWPVVMWVPTEQ